MYFSTRFCRELFRSGPAVQSYAIHEINRHSVDSVACVKRFKVLSN